MGIFTHGRKDSPRETTARRRIRNLPTPDLVPWAENCIYSVGRSLSEFRKTGEHSYLDEATMACEALLEVVEEIKNRAEAVAAVGEPVGL